MFKLTIEDDEGKTTVVPLARDEITIGRLEGNTIRLTERNVSRRHARLVRQNGAIYIEDLASFTGVLMCGISVSLLFAIVTRLVNRDERFTSYKKLASPNATWFEELPHANKPRTDIAGAEK